MPLGRNFGKSKQFAAVREQWTHRSLQHWNLRPVKTNLDVEERRGKREEREEEEGRRDGARYTLIRSFNTARRIHENDELTDVPDMRTSGCNTMMPLSLFMYACLVWI